MAYLKSLTVQGFHPCLLVSTETDVCASFVSLRFFHIEGYGHTGGVGVPDLGDLCVGRSHS